MTEKRAILEEVTAYFVRQPFVTVAVALGHFRVRPFIDEDGKRLLLFQRRYEGKRYFTIAAVDTDGNVYICGSVTTATDFDAKKWNPS